MKTSVKKTLLAALPLAGLLLTAPAAFAHDYQHQHRHWKNGEHCQTDYGRGRWDRGRYDDYRPSWYSGRRYYDRNDYYRSYYPQQPYDNPWWQSFFYR